MLTPEQKKKNTTLGLILASVVIVFFTGFMVRLVYFGSPKKPQMVPLNTTVNAPTPSASKP
jgi:hypothetical protein